ncbi:MAG TPA: aromatic ring-hydroxylating dioxygenase subunit alpha, partial [Candidatus Polarisedimenticolia bacterium]|nr:aromatic ring-hydroxylating dioxygenase subunit alpha [Candidatus Polarisedimenticolia bacterium]
IQEATTLPGRYYWDPAVYRAEVERIFTRMWVCVGRDEDLPGPGDYLTRDIGRDSVIVVRDQASRVQAFHNVCRHRGSRLLTEPQGRGLKSILCPYHAWTYELDGALRKAPHMEEVQSFEKGRYGLNPVRLDRWEGFLFISLSTDVPPLREHLGEMATRFASHGLAGLRRGRLARYTVASNWKILCENYSECYHCALIHPELNRISHYMSGQIDLINGATVGGWMELRQEEFQTMTLSGRSRRPPLPGLSGEDLRRIHYYIVYPNMLLSLHPDYVMTHLLWPREPGSTDVVCEFLFHPGTMAQPGFDPSDAFEFWDLTNRQDWRACELTQRGVESSGYDRGRLSPLEWMTHTFDNFVADRLMGRAHEPTDIITRSL